MKARAAFAIAAALAAASPALGSPAARPSSAPPDLTIDSAPVLGTGGSIAYGWNEILVVVQNNGAKPARGHIDVSVGQTVRSPREFRTTAPFAVGPSATVNVRVPAQIGMYGDVTIEVFDDGEHSVAQKQLNAYSAGGFRLLDVSESSPLRGAIQEVAIAPLFVTSSSSNRSIYVASPRFDPATGDPVLPDRAAVYASVHAVLMRSDVLARLAGAELDALAGFVLAGGTLAVAITRPEDVRNAALAAFAGGPITAQGVSSATLADLHLTTPGAGIASSSGKVIPWSRDPSSDLADRLVGYAGGNLHGSLYGSSATYGLGEVHLLAFDPTRKPAVDDPWAQARVADLLRRAYDRRSTQVFPPGDDAAMPSYTHLRKELDPNENSRWAIGAAALLLLVYAVVAGPVNFSLASKAGKPLRALRWLPAFAAAAFAMVVAIGIAAKGFTGRARHITLAEVGAGMPKGSARRFRGFYASRAKELTVRTTDASSVVSTAVVAGYSDMRDHLVVDRDGARLVDVAALPWQTVVVREDGFASIGDGIALVHDGAAGIAIVNRTGRDLRGAILRAPGGEAYYFARLRDGERTSTDAAHLMAATAEGRAWESAMISSARSGTITLHHPAAYALRPVTEIDAPGLADAWSALEEAAGDAVDWFPDGVPTLIGQLDGGEGRSSDAGLRLESDRLLVRVVGYGGRP